MDLDRGIIKALFYDYPVDALVAQLDKNKNHPQQDVFLDILPQLVQWSKQEYTYTEANLLRIQTGGKWVQNTSHSLPTIYHPFDVIKVVAEQLLTTEDSQPLVQFLRLFRWKDTTLYIGEDILTTAYLANYDLNTYQPERKMFIWDDILPHNNGALNDVLEKGLADLHAHYNATTDVFNLNWISLTNNIQLRKKLDKISRPQEIELLSTQTEYPSTLKQQCVAAAYLRFMFYCLLLKPEYACFDKEGEYIEKNYPCKVNKILTDPWFADTLALELQAATTNAMQSSMPTADGRHVDYCLLPSQEVCNMLLDKGDKREIVNLLYHGERQLLYKFFYSYYGKNEQCLNAAPYFYLYILLKNKIRREFVQINAIKGFENFEEYQNRKDMLIPEWSPILKYYPYCVRNSSTHTLDKDYLEVRVTPKSIVRDKFHYNKPIFELSAWCVSSATLSKDNANQFDMVVHFIKNGKYESTFPTQFNKVGSIKDCTRDRAYRRDIKLQIFDVLRVKTRKHVVGIDAASREIFCRPEVFGHVYRYAALKGIPRKTYHAGEDFLDIVDGLRAIDEAILFLELDDTSRIGHAMALGVNAGEYYERRHYSTIITKQYLLDDCVWLYMRSKELNVAMSSAFKKLLKDTAMKLFDEIGYHNWDIQHYWQSMLLRGNDPEYINSTNDYAWLSLWDKTANSGNTIVQDATRNSVAKELFSDYFYNKKIIVKGMELVPHKWDKEIVTIVNEMQKKMQYEISNKRISIECCPTSNLKIGYIDKYEKHPLLTTFYPIDKVNNEPSYPLIKSSINTDDRGVFHTSIYEEYSLIALALYKQKKEGTNEPKYNEREIMRYIREIRKNAELMAFSRHLEK